MRIIHAAHARCLQWIPTFLEEFAVNFCGPHRLAAAAFVAAFVVIPWMASAQGGGPEPTFNTYTRTTAIPAGATGQLALEVDLGEGWHVNSNTPLDQFSIPTVLTIEPPEGFTLDKVVYPPHIMYTFSFSPDPVAAYEGHFVLGAQIAVGDNVAPGEYTIPAKLRYQACNDKACYMPRTVDITFPVTVAAAGTAVDTQHADVFAPLDFEADRPSGAEPSGSTEDPAVPTETAATETSSVDESEWRALVEDFAVTGVGIGYINADDFIDLVDQVEQGQAATNANAFAGRSVWVVVALTLLGGLGLNLTPCVLPLIPITIAIIGAGAQAGSKARGFALGGAYGAGMAAAYGGLGLIVVLTAGSFGTINASPWFNLAIAILFVILALAMFDKILIDFSRFQAKFSGKRNEHGSILVAVGFGAVSALLAGACVAPIVIWVITYATDLYADGYPIALLLPFVLGVGMALPWPFAGAGLSFLPKPGKWMVRVKQAFGVMILLVAAWYAKEAYSLFSERWVDAEDVEASAQALDEEGWTASLSHGLATAKAENKPVIIDFWATWCKSCQTMNLTTFKNDAVNARLEDYVKVKYQAEDMTAEPAKSILEHFDVRGLPTYIFLEPK